MSKRKLEKQNDKKLLEVIEKLEIKLKQLENDFDITREEHEKSSREYLKMLEKREKAESALMESQNLLDSIVQTVPDIIYRLDPEGKITFISESVRKLGYEPKELIGTHILDLIPPEDRDKAVYRLNERRTGERKTKSFEIRFLKKNLKTMPFEVRFKILEVEKRIFLVDSEGLYKSNKPKHSTFLGTQGIARDITERVKAEEEKKRLELQFFQAQKMESIGLLAGGIAHDFNNVLTGIMGYAEVLKARFNDSSSTEGKAADVILRGAERASNLTQQLLGFARGGRYNPVPLNINNVIKDSIKMFENIFEKNITVEFDFDEQIKTIEADKNQIDQVITNIILNSRDAMPHGGILTFKTENDLIDNDNLGRELNIGLDEYVKISISDSGVGIPDDIKNKIFDPFFSTKGTGKGTGLGLATVYGIIKNHKGFIDVSSLPGKGTTFIIHLPVVKKEIIEKKPGKKIYGGNEAILLVEDETDLRSLAKMQLESLGYKVFACQDGIEAIKTYKKKTDSIDLVLLDMIMPNMNGKEVFNKLKEINPDVKVVLTSGYSQEGKATDILKNGAISFLQKPFKLHDLSKIIDEAIKVKN